MLLNFRPYGRKIANYYAWFPSVRTENNTNLLGGELGLHLAQFGLDQGQPPCQVPSWSIQPFGHNGHRPKIGEGAGPLFGQRTAGYPSNTKSPGPMPTSILSGILIHPAIWPQQVWAKNWVVSSIANKQHCLFYSETKNQPFWLWRNHLIASA